jgi:hypothetical protein
LFSSISSTILSPCFLHSLICLLRSQSNSLPGLHCNPLACISDVLLIHHFEPFHFARAWPICHHNPSNMGGAAVKWPRAPSPQSSEVCRWLPCILQEFMPAYHHCAPRLVPAKELVKLLSVVGSSATHFSLILAKPLSQIC